MALATRAIKRRMKSVASTKKIMKAMELEASSKMRRASQMTLAGRPYATSLAELTSQVFRLLTDPAHPLLVGYPAVRRREPKHLVVVSASDRGLCGGYNSQIIKKALEVLRGYPREQTLAVTIGIRAEQALKRAGYLLHASFHALSNAPSFDKTLPIGQLIYQLFKDQQVSDVCFVYSHFTSALLQTPTAMPLLPLKDSVFDKELSTTVHGASEQGEADSRILIEPTAGALLARLLPRLLEMKIYQALLEASASEHASRMMTMRSATDAAGDMLEDLRFTLNQARQSSITREISEIAASKAAIE